MSKRGSLEEITVMHCVVFDVIFQQHSFYAVLTHVLLLLLLLLAHHWLLGI